MPDPTKPTTDEAQPYNFAEIAGLAFASPLTGIVLSVLVLHISGGL